MSWRRLLSTPSPSTAFVLEEGRLLAVRHDRRDRVAHAEVVLPPRSVECGRVGLQSVQRDALQPALARLQSQIGAGRRPIVILPTGWMRVHLLDFEAVPRKRAQLEEVVRWRLKKLLPVPATELRLDLVPLTPINGRKRLLCVTALERALRELEAAFVATGMEPSVLTGRLFALAEAMARPATRTLVVQQEPGFLAVAMLDGDQPIMVRTKPLPELGDRPETVRRELGVVLAYVRGALAIEEPIGLCVSAHDDGLAEAVTTWGRSQDELFEVAPPVAEGVQDTQRAALAPAWGLLAGAGV